MKVLVAMSGGVDSSVTAHLLAEAGYEVEGLSLRLFEARGRGPGASGGAAGQSCCSLEAMDDAARAAERIGIPHRIIDARDEFITKVVGPFVESYASGLTPNPCILCNKYVKFPALMREALAGGAERIATGHYAKVVQGPGGPALMRGVDPKKDQSYFLYVLDGATLGMLLLPLGDMKKDATRRVAEEAEIPSARRPESQEICFVEDRGYSSLVAELSSAPEPGPIIDATGREVGIHRGIHHYTVGQRKGLGSVSSKVPLYVTRIEPGRNAIHVGPREAAMSSDLKVAEINWLAREPEADLMAEVKVRSTMAPAGAAIEPLESGTARVRFNEPQWAPAPGQAAVFYLGERVLGGGTII